MASTTTSRAAAASPAATALRSASASSSAPSPFPCSLRSTASLASRTMPTGQAGRPRTSLGGASARRAEPIVKLKYPATLFPAPSPDASCCLIPTLARWRPVIAGAGTARQRAGPPPAVSDHTPAWLERQAVLYFLPLPHGHGSVRPALAFRAGRGGPG